MAIGSCTSKVNTLFYNDLHGSTKNIKQFAIAQDEFYKEHEGETNITVSGGDVFMDASPNNDILAKELCARTDAIAIGNVDINAGNYLGQMIKKYAMQGKWLSCNLTFNRKNDIEDQIQSSTIIDKNNERIGVIGVSPFDFQDRLYGKKDIDFINVLQLNETKKNIKKEVAKLEQAGVNKIFLAAHTGETSKGSSKKNNGEDYEKYYDEFSKIGGIDVIIGGHDHKHINKWATTERGEPVRIVSTGAGADYLFKENLNVVGLMSNTFDEDGVLIKEASNCEIKTIDGIQVDADDNNLPVIHSLDKPLNHLDSIKLLKKGHHGEIGNMVADSNLWYVNKHTKGDKADFAFVNPGNIRANLDKTKITAEDVQSVVPFVTSTLIKTQLSKEQIINTLNWCAHSTLTDRVVPGVMQVSGMEYTIHPDLTVSDVHILNEDGSIKYNLDDYNDEDLFTGVYDTFLATGCDGLDDLVKDCENDNSVEVFDATRERALLEYLTQNDKLMDYTQIRIKHS